MIKRMKNKLFATLCVAALTLGAVVPSSFNSVQAAGTKTVYVDVEKNVIGQNPIVQPVKVELSDTDTILGATRQAAGTANVTSDLTQYGNYVTGFADTTHDFASYPYEKQLKDLNTLIFNTNIPLQPIVTDGNWLKEKEYTGVSGWIFTVENTDNDGNYNYYNADTTLGSLPNDAVIRWEFSAACGADIGLYNAYLPTQLKADGHYDWMNNTAAFPARFVRADKTALIRAMANHSNKADQAYVNALDTLKDLDATSTEVSTAMSGL